MSIVVLKEEFLKLEKTEQVDFGRFVLEKLFSNIEENKSILTEEQQQIVEERYKKLKKNETKLTSLIDFKSRMTEKYGL